MASIEATLAIFSMDLCATIEEAIERKGQFTTVTDNKPGDFISTALALFCISPYQYADTMFEISHIGIIRKGMRVSTGQVRIKATNLIPLKNLTLDGLKNALPEKFRSNCEKAFSIGYKAVGDKTGEQIFDALINLYPDQAESIHKLWGKAHPKISSAPESRLETAAAEKDALGICLDIFGVDRAEILQNWEYSGDSVNNSFLNGLQEYSAYEDDILSKDLHAIPGWQILSEDISGIVNFQNEEGEKLTVINANRKPLEKAMGVDLIYYHRKYHAFTFVQYKMMDQRVENIGEYYYNPIQRSHDDELKRMQKLYDGLLKEKQGESLNDFRIGNCPIFFKLCKKLEFKQSSTSISAGAYIPLTQWTILLGDDSTKGPKGGRQLGYHTLQKRYIGTQVFVDLMQRGFLGTQALGSTKVALFIEDAIKRGSSVMYAIDERKELKSR